MAGRNTRSSNKRDNPSGGKDVGSNTKKVKKGKAGSTTNIPDGDNNEIAAAETSARETDKQHDAARIDAQTTRKNTGEQRDTARTGADATGKKTGVAKRCFYNY